MMEKLTEKQQQSLYDFLEKKYGENELNVYISQQKINYIENVEEEEEEEEEPTPFN